MQYDKFKLFNQEHRATQNHPMRNRKNHQAVLQKQK